MSAMTIDTLIMLAGAFVAIMPFLGFPNSWDTVLYFFAGIFVIALGIIVRRRGLGDRSGRITSRPMNGNTFTESSPTHEEDSER